TAALKKTILQRRFLVILLGLSLATTQLSSHALSTQLPSTDFDLLITNGRILDGSGNPWFVADVGIANGKIIEIGKIDPSRAKERIDAKGLVVAPGFIDVHTHLEGAIEQVPDAENLIMMGVTTVVTGNCGLSALKLSEWFDTVAKNGAGV